MPPPHGREHSVQLLHSPQPPSSGGGGEVRGTHSRFWHHYKNVIKFYTDTYFKIAYISLSHGEFLPCRPRKLCRQQLVLTLWCMYRWRRTKAFGRSRFVPNTLFQHQRRTVADIVFQHRTRHLNKILYLMQSQLKWWLITRLYSSKIVYFKYLQFFYLYIVLVELSGAVWKNKHLSLYSRWFYL